MGRRTGKTKRLRAVRALATLCALVLVAARLGMLAHFAAVEHSVCVEHGRLVHRHAHSEPAHDLDLDPEPGAGALVGASQSHGHHGPSHDQEAHQHCDLCFEAQSAEVWSAEVRVTPAPAPIVAAITASQLVTSSGPAVYSIAPKTSPPA
jgi:hypothetical protein